MSRRDADRTLLPTATRRETRRAVAALVGPRWALALATVAVVVTTTAVGLAGPALLGRIVDAVTTGRPAGAITGPAAALAAVAVVVGVLTALGRILLARLTEGTVADLRERLMDRAVDLDIDTVERAGRGDLVARLADDVRVLGQAGTEVVPTVAEAGFTIALTLGSLAILDWRFALAALVAAPIQVHTVRWHLARSRPAYEAARVADGARAQQLLGTLSGAATIRALRLGPAQLTAVEGRSLDALRQNIVATNLVTRFYGRLNLAEVAGLGSVLVAGFVLVRAGSATVGVATAAALYFHRLFNPINQLLGNLDTAQSAAAALARVVGVVNLPRPAPPAEPAGMEDRSVTLLSVGHEYRAGHPVVAGVTLHVESGERLALVGASGAGKTTLAKIVAGIHQPTAGEVRLGRRPLADLDPDAVRRAVALVAQEVHTFAGPLADDLRLARPDATDDEVTAALDAAGARGWVRALPDGLATVVGEGGHRLTATQAQQVALARVALRDPAIVILDEATADAGSAGARLLEAAANRVLAGRTAIVVAHRLTQAAAADRIAVLDGGRLVAVGTHADLLAAGGLYAELWNAWSDGRHDRSPTPPLEAA
ncbi:MAG: ABC transporter ATP-binding protein [Actinomycetota bacterium]|jgi:ATP-binding cassette, subfamily C, bacterial